MSKLNIKPIKIKPTKQVTFLENYIVVISYFKTHEQPDISVQVKYQIYLVRDATESQEGYMLFQKVQILVQYSKPSLPYENN